MVTPHQPRKCGVPFPSHCAHFLCWSLSTQRVLANSRLCITLMDPGVRNLERWSQGGLSLFQAVRGPSWADGRLGDLAAGRENYLKSHLSLLSGLRLGFGRNSVGTVGEGLHLVSPCGCLGFLPAWWLGGQMTWAGVLSPVWPSLRSHIVSIPW